MPKTKMFDVNEAKELRESGWTWKQLAEKYGVHRNTLKYHVDDSYRLNLLSRQLDKYHSDNGVDYNRKLRNGKRHEKVTYFVRSGQYVKVGYTINLTKRLSDLQMGSPHTLELLGVTDENECDLHVKFAHYHFDREWFVLSDEIKEWVNENCRDTP